MENMLVKKLALTVSLITLCASLAACNSTRTINTDAGKANIADPTQSEETTIVEVTTVPEEISIPEETTIPEEATIPEETTPPEDPTITEEPTPPDLTVPPEETIPDGADEDWLNMKFTLDGVTYQLPCAYKELEANGWTFDVADYGYENGYVLNPGDKLYSTIYLKNSAYSDKIAVSVGFVNKADTVQDIYECDIWSIRVQTDYAFKLVDPRPEMSIGNGLKFGDSKDLVFSKCGECPEDDTFINDEYGYSVYEYSQDFTFYLKINVYDEYGITSFELQDYSR